MSDEVNNYYHERIQRLGNHTATHPTHELGIVKRYEGNPILTSLPEHSWANRKVYNASVILIDQLFTMVFRAVGDDGKSRLGQATSTDGIHFTPENDPIFEGTDSYESVGAEDPRITYIDNRFVMCYTAYDGICAREAVAVSEDLRNWERYGPIFPDWHKGIWNTHSEGDKNWSKAGALFPERIDGQYLMLFGDDYIWPAYSSDLRTWSIRDRAILEPREGYFDAGFIEMGPPPIKTDKGWLIIYHGIEGVVDRPGNPRVYRLGAALLDSDDPTRIIWRCSAPLLEPKGKEKEGFLDVQLNVDEYYEETGEERDETDHEEGPSAIFCCGAVEKDGTLYIYYSSMDTALNLATCSLAEILQH